MYFIKKVSDILEEVIKKEKAELYYKTHSLLRYYEDFIDDEIERTLQDRINEIIKKIEDFSDLDVNDINTIRIYLTGEKKLYDRLKNDYKNLKRKLKEYTVKFKKMEHRDSSIENMMKLKRLLKDTIKIVDEIAYFLELKEKFEKYSGFVENLSKVDNRKILKVLKKELNRKIF